MSDYSKHKESQPGDTVFRIQQILHDAGLFPVLRWTNSSLDGVRSNRVTLHPTNLGTNGKGTDEPFATASGYAELMERIQNNLLCLRDKADGLSEELGFQEFPDERQRSIADILDDPDPYTAYALDALELDGYLARHAFLREVASTYGKDATSLPVVPFADLVGDEIVWVPQCLVVAIAGSNGMAAGNTLEEAMVQGLSELFERAVSRQILMGKATPPQIPDDAVRDYSFFDLIEQVRSQGRYRVTLYDCSLGQGWPVAAVCVADTLSGTFGFKLGAHPSMAVAIERTLTEALQARSIEQFAHTCSAGSLEAAASFHNVANVSKTGVGIYPWTLFVKEPDWEFQPWTRWEGLDNRGFLKEMLHILIEADMRPLIRDSSFLGFPACFIAVPGFSDLYVANKTLAHSIVSAARVFPAWAHFPDLSDEEEDRLLRLIRFKRDSEIENHVESMSGRPLSSAYSLDRIGALLSLKKGDYAGLIEFLRRMASSTDEEPTYLTGMAAYAQARQLGADADGALRLVDQLFDAKTAGRIREDVSDIPGLMRRSFKHLSCYDCLHCEARNTGCSYPEVRATLAACGRAMRCDNVSQESLLRSVHRLCV